MLVLLLKEGGGKLIRRIGDKYRVESKGGRNMGEYDNKKDAEKRLRQIEYFKKAVVETDFVKQYPQLIGDLKEKMSSMSQQEAELQIAKEKDLSILAKLVRNENRWFNMLKEGGPVTTSTAGIATRPIFSRKKKKKEDEDE